MKLLLQSAIIFFGTLMAAGFVALGEPTRITPSASTPSGTRHAVNHYVDPQRSSAGNPTATPANSR
jgi:hypothetical protein